MGLSDSLGGMGFVPQPKLPLLDAPLLAEAGYEFPSLNTLATFVPSLSDDSPIGHNGINQISGNPSSIIQNGISQVAINQINRFQPSSSQISSTQVYLSQTGISQTGIGQISTTEVNSSQASLEQENIRQVSPTEVDIFYPSLIHLDSTQIGTTQINTDQIRTSQIGILQNNVSQNSNLYAWTNKVNTAEVSFSSVVTAQQFINGNGTLHSSTYAPISATTNSALISWNSLLQNTVNPLKLNIEIADLPTGQLAEATITGFDPTGRPNSGTLYLDTDANGLVWYLDPTPWDNTEYSQTLTDTAYRATADSAAYGHYDLLTTLLHETAHLQGFISGYSNYDNHIQTQNGSSGSLG
jgi:hypothetical protein